MRQMARRTITCKPHMTMAFNAFVTTTTGVVLLSPASTFSSSSAWRILAELHLGHWYPTEESWGALILVLAVLMWVSLWFIANLEHLLEAHPEIQSGRLPSYRFASIVWQLGFVLWGPLGLSFIFSKPDSIGAWVFMAMAATSEWVTWRVGRMIRAAD